MANMRELGEIIGGAIANLKDRLVALEEAKPEPPVVTVNVPEQPAIEIDLAALTEAITGASVAESVSELAEAVKASAKASGETDAAFQQVLVDMMGQLQSQQEQISLLVKNVDGLGSQLVSVIAAPKELTFDDDGEPVGVRTVKNLN